MFHSSFRLTYSNLSERSCDLLFSAVSCVPSLRELGLSSNMVNVPVLENCMWVLYCTVLYCTVLYCTVLYCTVLYWTVRLPPAHCLVIIHNFYKSKILSINLSILSLILTFTSCFSLFSKGPKLVINNILQFFQWKFKKCQFRPLQSFERKPRVYCDMNSFWSVVFCNHKMIEPFRMPPPST